MKKLLYIGGFFCLLFPLNGLSQDGEIHHDLEHDSANHFSNIKEIFKKGHTEGHIRNYFMATINEGSLTDYWANAIGGSLGYHTARWHGFQVGVKGIFTFNLASSDLNKIDPVAQKSAHWEKELFDITRPEERKDLDRLEELYIKYHFKQSFITFGKIDINKGPLLLKRDGRMKPFVYKGLWTEFRELKHQQIYAGWIYAVSPRGMTEWYSLNEAIGLSSNGYLPDGEHSEYHEHSNTKGLLALGYENDFFKDFKLMVWNYYLHHMYNINWLQADYENKRLFAGIQYVHQMADPYQSTLDFENRVYQPDEKGNVIATQIGLKTTNQSTRLSAGYLHSFDKGRFIFPQELTRENFYISQPRSWVDGFGAVDMYMLRWQFTAEKGKYKGLSTDLRVSRIQVNSEEANYTLNKYGRTSYNQATLVATYSFQKKLSGLHFSLLYAHRFLENSQHLHGSEKFYRTNFHHINLMINIHF
jgi:hypothetical protein